LGSLLNKGKQMNNKKYQELQALKAKKKADRIKRETELAWQEYYRLARRTAQTPFDKDYRKGAN
jgi:hypothetical protein